jgi:hypothetical protein
METTLSATSTPDDIVAALEVMAVADKRAMATYALPDSKDILVCIHKYNMAWPYQPEYARAGPFAWRVLIQHESPSKALRDGRDGALRLVTAARRRLTAIDAERWPDLDAMRAEQVGGNNAWFCNDCNNTFQAPRRRSCGRCRGNKIVRVEDAIESR